MKEERVMRLHQDDTDTSKDDTDDNRDCSKILQESDEIKDMLIMRKTNSGR